MSNDVQCVTNMSQQPTAPCESAQQGKYWVHCPYCDARGTYKGEICPKCNGIGKLVIERKVP